MTQTTTSKTIAYPLPLVVIFGGAGYIGCRIVDLLLKEGYRVRIVDNFVFGRDGIKAFDDPNLEIIEGDICETRTVSSSIKGADTVLLLAAVVGRRAADIKDIHAREINFLASSVVLDAAIEHGVSRFLFASTDSVYGTQSGVMYETRTPEPVSLYSRLKLRMEERIINAKRREFHPTALRIATCYGYSPRMRFDLVVNGLVRDAICKKEIIIESGDQWRSLVHVDDTAAAFLAAIKAHVNLISGEVFNVGAQDQNVTLKQLANMVKIIAPETNIILQDQEPDLVDYHLSSSKISKILDFSPKWTIEASMEDLKNRLTQGEFPEPYHFKYHNT